MSESPEFNIVTRWTWHHQGSLQVRILDIVGGQMPQTVRGELSHAHPPNLPATSELCQQAQLVADNVVQRLPEPDPLDLGGSTLRT